MNSESQKAQAFVLRLLQNPALSGFSALQKEEQIIQFLQVNAAQLAPTLSSAQFFPGKNWNAIVTTLHAALFEVINQELHDQLDQLVGGRIDLTFINLLRQQQGGLDPIRTQILEFVKRILTRSEVRRAFTGAYSGLVFRIPDRYIDQIFARKSYVHFELTKVQRLRLGKDEMKHFIELTMLLKPVVNAMGAEQTQQERATGMVQNQYADKVFNQMRRELKLLPEQVLKSAVHASVSFNENRFIEATSRLAAVWSARARNYQPNMKVDRGADSPDKSWLNTARRNYKFYGFDVKLLDELYSIAAENNW